MKLVSIKPSDKAGKKYDAIFNIDGVLKTVSFGAKGYSDFTIHKDETRKKNYLARHITKEDWNNPLTPGALSRWVLWNKTSLRDSIADFKSRFKI
jgi:hypothetical protein